MSSNSASLPGWVPIPDPFMPMKGQYLELPTSTGETVKVEVMDVLGSGPFSDVYRVEELSTRRCFALKCEKKSAKQAVLKLDACVLTRLKGTTGFPELAYTGSTDYYKFVAMELVGSDLGRLRRAMPEKRFTVSTALRVAKQTLSRIEALHEKHFLCRDVKAPNFAIGLGSRARTVYMLDFGFAQLYKDKNGVTVPRGQAAALLGTIQYAPLAAHYCERQCRRDDLESWLYMCVEIFSGALPWSKIPKPVENQIRIANWKQYVRVQGKDNFFKECPQEFIQILGLVDDLDFYDIPQYRRIQILLEDAMERLGIHDNDPFDWEHNNGALQQRATFVGELGQSDFASIRMRQAEQAFMSERLFEETDLRTPPIDTRSG